MTIKVDWRLIPRVLHIVVLAGFAASGGPVLAASQSYPLFSTNNTNALGVSVEPVRYKGLDGLHVIADPDHKGIDAGGCDNCTILKIEGVDFSNGTIEIEVAGKPQQGAPAWARGFVGVVFRVNEEASRYEGIYLRPENARESSQIRRNHTVQYFSYPDYPWKTLRDSSPGVYESWADIETGEWTRMRIEVDGENAELYLNGSRQPALIVSDLKHGASARGTIGLFTEPTTDAYFRNLMITHR